MIGEMIVLKHLGGNPSLDAYDHEKDLILPDGSSAEVKTQTRFRKVDAFTAELEKTTNLKKCLTVNRLFFVEFDDTDSIKLWDCIDRTYFKYETKYKTMACWPVSDMVLLKTINNPVLTREMRNLSNSDLYDKSKRHDFFY